MRLARRAPQPWSALLIDSPEAEYRSPPGPFVDRAALHHKKGSETLAGTLENPVASPDRSRRRFVLWRSTKSRATLFIVERNRNITLSLPRELLRRIKRLAADRDTSVSSMMVEALTRLADEDRRYSAARKRAIAAMRSARSLGTGGRRTWSRDELHER